MVKSFEIARFNKREDIREGMKQYLRSHDFFDIRYIRALPDKLFNGTFEQLQTNIAEVPMDMAEANKKDALKEKIFNSYIDASTGQPSYTSTDLPTIHMLFEDETSTRPSLDKRARHKDLTVILSLYSNSSLVFNGGQIKEVPFKSVNRPQILPILEELALATDITLSSLDEMDTINLVDLLSLSYIIDKESDSDGVFGLCQLTYNIQYFIQYP